MARMIPDPGHGRRWRRGGLAWLLVLALLPVCGRASSPLPTAPAPLAPVQLPQVVPLPVAVQWALEHNPELAALRQQHGIAAAGVVIAHAYPFNPVYEGKVRAAFGPASAGVTNSVNNEHVVLFEMEIFGQRQHRAAGANAALSRTDWEIANQEVTLAVRVIRAYLTVLYRQEKLRLVHEIIRLDEQAFERVNARFQGGEAKLRPDVISLRTEIDSARAQLAPAQANLVAAWTELRRAMGVVDASFDVLGTLEVPPVRPKLASLLPAAKERRADLHAREAAVAEAEARLRLEVANRYGNPTVGPVYELDPTRIDLVGLQLHVPLPVLDTHRGEIQQREAERARASLELRETEVLVEQDLQAALTRLDQGLSSVELYRNQLIPNLQKSLQDIERSWEINEATTLNVIAIRRSLLGARDLYLDAQWEVTQAEADLAAAVGDPRLGTCVCPPPTGLAPCPVPPPGAPVPAPLPELAPVSAPPPRTGIGGQPLPSTEVKQASSPPLQATPAKPRGTTPSARPDIGELWLPPVDLSPRNNPPSPSAAPPPNH
jgi:cobalt-zinc-cadmium efflux system outer membrane protein